MMKKHLLQSLSAICSSRLITMIALFVFCLQAHSQITITFTVDMGGKPIGAGGVHIAGEFLTRNSTTIFEDWMPSAEGSEMSLLYGSVYGIDVSFPSSEAGHSLQFQFVRDNVWANEHGDMSEGNIGTHLSYACGVDDGFGGYNRIISIPGCNADYNANWDYCAEFSAVSISISPDGPVTFCQGGNVILTATHTGTTLQWTRSGVNIPGATNSTYTATKKGDYTCTTTSVCGTATSSVITVDVNNNPTASITAGGATTFCTGGSVVLTANAGGGLIYQWYKSGVLITGATSINYTATEAGNYKCRVTKSATGCSTNSNMIAVNIPCRMGEEMNKDELLLFPNPSTGQFNLSAQLSSAGSAIIKVYNNYGELVFSEEFNTLTTEISKSIELNQPAGIYLVQLSNGQDVSETRMIIQ